MAYCYEMKTGEIYVCRWCGFEVQVLKEGEDLGHASEKHNCAPENGFGALQCCGEAMTKKKT